MNAFSKLILSLLLLIGSLSSAEDSKDSIYVIDKTWTNESGKSLNLSELKGTPTVITMLYLSCPHTCPMIVTKLKEIEKKLIQKKITSYRIVLASFDFEKDTPQQLKKFMDEKKISSDHWTLLTASNDEVVRSLSIVLGISYKKLQNGDFSHSNIISALDEQGRILSHIDRLSADSTPLIEAIEKNGKTK